MAQRAVRERRQPVMIEVRAPVAGMRTIVPSADLDPAESPYIRDFMLLYGEIVRRPGYSKFGSASLPLSGAPIMQFGLLVKEDASKLLVAMTKTKIYAYNSGADTWSAITQTQGDFTGTDADIFDTCQMQDSIIYGQGINETRQWTGTGNATRLLADLKSKYCESWLNRVFLGYVTEGGAPVVHASRIKCTTDGSLIDFSSVGSVTADLLDTPGDITRLRKLSSGELAIYKPKYIDVATPTGYATVPFTIVPGRVQGSGNIAPFSLGDIGGRHIYLSEEGLKIFDGNTEQELVPQIRNELFPKMNQGRLNNVISFVQHELNLYWLFVPSKAATLPDIVWIIDYKANTAVRASVSGTAVGTYLAAVAPTIDSQAGLIDSYTTRFDDYNVAASAPQYLLGNSAGNTFKFDSGLVKDDTAVIAAEWQSKDFTLEGRIAVLDTVYVDMRAYGLPTGIICEASVDLGVTWITAYPTSDKAIISDVYEIVQFYFYGVVGRHVRIRFRFSDSQSNMSIRYIALKFRDGGSIFDKIQSIGLSTPPQ